MHNTRFCGETACFNFYSPYFVAKCKLYISMADIFLYAPTTIFLYTGTCLKIHFSIFKHAPGTAVECAGELSKETILAFHKFIFSMLRQIALLCVKSP